MDNQFDEKQKRLREFFEIKDDAALIPNDRLESFDASPEIADNLARHNIEWHVIPSAEAVNIDTDDYRRRLYPTLKFDAVSRDYQKTESFHAIMNGHEKHQGRVVGVETTMKPIYLPGNHQFYGTHYGFEAQADPFAPYFGAAKIMSGTRFSHNYSSLRNFVNVITEDWQARDLIPKNYRVTICPPVIFNLIGAVFHPEWSQTPTLELGFYRDRSNNAKCYAVGSNAPGDFSYLKEIESDSDWNLLGFRIAVVPE
ncbi:MAG: hypothetical protein M3T96_00130 [Acidobacteriota bacterium]|nr:hypothetical protein [Acidobacteriota bacterium]